jgi:hypothetical protein
MVSVHINSEVFDVMHEQFDMFHDLSGFCNNIWSFSFLFKICPVVAEPNLAMILALCLDIWNGIWLKEPSAHEKPSVPKICTAIRSRFLFIFSYKGCYILYFECIPVYDYGLHWIVLSQSSYHRNPRRGKTRRLATTKSYLRLWGDWFRPHVLSSQWLTLT